MDERQITYLYQCESGHISSMSAPAKERDARPAEMACTTCSEVAKYNGFVRQKSQGMTRIPFEHNGIKGFKYQSDRGVSYMSADKRGYYETGVINHQYTPQYEKHLKETGQEQMLHADVTPGKGKASLHKEKRNES